MPAPPSGPAPATGRRKLLFSLAILAAAMLAHAASLSADLLYDDLKVVVHNPKLEAESAGDWGDLLLAPYWNQPHRDLLWRPLPLLTYAVQKTAGAGAGAFHLVNLILHAGVSLLLGLLGRRLWRDDVPALLCALLFAVHPLASEAVTLVVGRADLLVALWALAAILLVDRRRQAAAGPALLLALAGLTALACLSKENGFALPLLLLAWLGGRRLSATGGGPMDGAGGGQAAPRSSPVTVRATWAASDLLPFLAAAAAAGSVLLARLSVLGRLMREAPSALLNNPIAHAGFWEGRAEALRLVVKALRLFVMPATLSVDYSYAATRVPELSGTVVVSTLAGLGAAAGALWLLRKRPVALLGLLFFGIAHLPTANLVVPIGTAFGERLLYLPMVGLCLTIVDLAWAAWQRATGSGGSQPAWQRTLAVVLLAALGAGLGVRTWKREVEYRDDLSLWRATVAAVPGSAKARYNLGRSLAARGSHLEAEAEYAAAVEIIPQMVEALNNLGSTRLRLGRPDAALAALDRAMAVAPGSASVAFNRALALHQAGRRDEAVREFGRGAGLDPEQASRLVAGGPPWSRLQHETPASP